MYLRKTDNKPNETHMTYGAQQKQRWAVKWLAAAVTCNPLGEGDTKTGKRFMTTVGRHVTTWRTCAGAAAVKV